ncbi:MAG: hypothetical protein ACI3V5_10390 [Faecousia sp.]
MKYPQLQVQSSTRQMVDAFRGYNHNLRISTGEFYDMKNMTSDFYPVLSPRGKRGVYAKPASPQGLIAKDAVCYVDAGAFVIGEERIEMGLSTAEADCPKQLISMGAYVIILPDKKYINTMDTEDFGSIEASFTTKADVTFSLCSVSGEAYTGAEASDTAPENPENLSYWIDTSCVPHTLKRYSSAGSTWVSVAATYIRIASPGIGAAFQQYDGVTISGIVKQELQDLNGTMPLWDCGEDYIVVVGILDAVTTQTLAEGSVTIQRKMPNMDYLTESENRLWGCRYGTAVNGETVNEIYACKLGDFKNWNCFMGLSTDSYAASCGTDGPFTGAVTHLGYPLFFKENCVHKVYGNYPGNFQIQTTACRGVQKGCHGSLAIVNETLFYKSRSGICAYDGSLPTEAGFVLGNEPYSAAVGCAHGNKYYVSMMDEAGVWHLFVYDTAKGMWHREDNLHALSFCSCRGELYCVDADDRNIVTMLGSGEAYEGSVSWMVQTGELGISSPDMKYISRLTVRMSMEIGSEMNLYVQYDLSGEWVHVCNIRGTSLRSFSIPIRPRRCDHMKLRIEGVGGAKIYSITKTIEQGSELS